MHPKIAEDKAGECPICGMDLVKKKSAVESQESSAVWTCSMHPDIKEKEAGECPICGMDLEEKK